MAQRAPQLAAAHHASADRIRRTQQARRRVEVPGLKGRADAGAGHALAVEHHRRDGFGGKTVSSALALQRAQVAGAAMAEAELRADVRSEEPTSELQSLMRLSYSGLGLEKKQH